ncbi:MAG: methyltransferase domain-containing protein [Flavobacteriaceae bacterium]|nr:methyltransferase domain-containing protein [Flavobacteriaceae bacterium]
MNKKKSIVDAFNNNAELYQQKFMNLESFRDTFDIFCSHLPEENAELLDIGCGPGNITQYILNKRPEFHVFGIDIAPNMIALAKQNNPSASFAIIDATEIHTLKQQYDGIICGFCLPYLSQGEVAHLITSATQLLNKNGILYLSTMEDDYSKSGFKSSPDGKSATYTYYHTAKYLGNLFSNYGFKTVFLERKDYIVNSLVTAIDLIMIAKKTNS